MVEVERIVHVEDKEKVKKLEKRLAKEKAMIKRKVEEEKKRIMEQVNLAEEEKQKLLDEINEKADDQAKAQEKQEKLIKKLKTMEEKVLQGN